MYKVLAIFTLTIGMSTLPGQAEARSFATCSTVSSTLTTSSNDDPKKRCNHLKQAADDFWNNHVLPLEQQYQAQAAECAELEDECSQACSDLEQECDAIEQECTDYENIYAANCVGLAGSDLQTPNCIDLAQIIAECNVNSNNCQSDLEMCEEEQNDCDAEVQACDDVATALMQLVVAAVVEHGDLLALYQECVRTISLESNNVSK